MKSLPALFLASTLAGCAAVAVGGLPPLVPLPGNEQADIWIQYGVGGYTTSYGMGPGANSLAGLIQHTFGSTVRIIGFYQWTDDVASAMSAVPPSKKAMLFTYSCSASMGPLNTAKVTRAVDLLGGYQASEWCGGGQLAKNVRWAIETYNPNCFDTAGLGCWLWPQGPGFIPGHLTVVQRYDLHPYADLDPDAWNDSIGAMKRVLNPSLMAKRTPMDDYKVNFVTRHRGQRL